MALKNSWFQAQETGEIGGRDDPSDIALSIFFCFSAARTLVDRDGRP